MNGQTIQSLDAEEGEFAYFLGRFPEYKKTLRLAVTHEESARDSRTYQGWQWHDVETHPTKLIRLVTEGISRIYLRTRQATYYILRDRETVKRALSKSVAPWETPYRRLPDRRSRFSSGIPINRENL